MLSRPYGTGRTPDADDPRTRILGYPRWSLRDPFSVSSRTQSESRTELGYPSHPTDPMIKRPGDLCHANALSAGARISNRHNLMPRRRALTQAQDDRIVRRLQPWTGGERSG